MSKLHQIKGEVEIILNRKREGIQGTEPGEIVKKKKTH